MPSPMSCRECIASLTRPGNPGPRWTTTAPTEIRRIRMVSQLIKPPWGRITAIDLTCGKHAWQVANGGGIRDHEALRGLDLPPLGIASRGVALVTATLLFIGEGGNVFGGIQPNMWGISVPRLRQGDRERGLGDRAAGRHDRPPDELHA